MSARSSARAAKAKPIIAGSDEEADQKNRIDKLQKEKQDLLDGEWRASHCMQPAAAGRETRSTSRPLTHTERASLS